VRPRLQPDTILLVVTAGACVAFIASFVLGLGGGGGSAVTRGTPAAERTAAARPPVRAGRVEVLNASGRVGLARHVTGLLRDDHFDVVSFGNAPASAGDSSVVIARVHSDAVARAVGRALGISSIRTERDTALFLDATVIVGVDWVPAAEGTRSGWRRVLDRVRGSP
jgi:hypothetical protein